MTKVPLGKLAVIGAAVGALALAFAYTAGWLSPQRISPQAMLNVLVPPPGPALGHRRNHARGVCFTGTFEANGNGAEISKARVFERGQYPVVGRFNIAGSDPHAPEAMAAVRGLGVRIVTPDEQEWRMAMIDAPQFAAASPRDFFAFLKASGSKDPEAFKSYAAAHPEILTFVGWAKSHPRNESWAQDRFNSLDSFLFTNAAGESRAARWSFLPAAPPAVIPPQELAARDPGFLEQEMTARLAAGPQRWELWVTLANPGDPTADPTKPWPADRRSLDVGTLVAQKLVLEAGGPCRDINYDPSVLPPGITTSDDPFPAARSAAYRASYDHRLAESAEYPRHE